MTTMLIIECSALIFLLICSAFFSSAETALFSLNPVRVHRVRRSRPRAADRIEGVLAHPTHLLSTILIGNTLVNVAAAALGYTIADSLWPDMGEIISIPAMTLLLLVFGEVAPKRLAMTRAEKLAAAYSPVLGVLIRTMTPVRKIMELVTDLFEKHFRVASKTLTEDEFLTVVEVGEEEGVLDEEERTMVDGIIRLEEMQASDVMTPRVDLTGIDLDDPPSDRERIAHSVQFRYLPVYRGSLDQAECFLDVPRFLLSDSHDMDAALVPPSFVPETVPLDNLLATFQRENRRVAFVVDEFGGTAGLITRGDILEEIVDDVDNEYGEQSVPLQSIGDNLWLVDGSTSLEDINRELDMDIEAEGADRIAGWAIAQAEHIPRQGEVIEAQGCRVKIQRIRRQRILLIQLEKLPQREPEDGEEEDEQ